MPTPYEILEIEEDVSPKEIRNAYKQLSLKWHPDRWVSKSESERKYAEEKFKEINKAYKILSDSQEEGEEGDYGYSMGGNVQQWLEKWLTVNYSNQQFSSQGGSSSYTTLPGGGRRYDDSPRLSLNDPKSTLASLDIVNKNLEGRLSLSDFTNLRTIDLSGNEITGLDLNNCPNLQTIHCDNNPMTNLKFINRNSMVEIYFSQDRLLENKKELETHNKELSERVGNLEKEKFSLDEKNYRIKRCE